MAQGTGFTNFTDVLEANMATKPYLDQLSEKIGADRGTLDMILQGSIPQSAMGQVGPHIQSGISNTLNNQIPRLEENYRGLGYGDPSDIQSAPSVGGRTLDQAVGQHSADPAIRNLIQQITAQQSENYRDPTLRDKYNQVFNRGY